MKRLRRRLLRVALLLVALAVVLLLLAPTLLSTGPVRRMIEARIGKELGREVTLSGLDAGWTSGIKLSGLRIANTGPEFGDAALAEVGSIEITDPLTTIVFGAGPSRIVVAGLIVRVEERAGGRTNLDDLLEVLTRPPKKPRKPREPRPIAIELRDCSFRLQRLPRRAPARPVDPFEEDPPIRAADDGLFVAAIEELALTLATGPDGTDATVRGGIRVNDALAELDLTLEQRGDDVKGKGSVRGLDLALLSPFVDGNLAGVLDLVLDGDTRSGLDVRAEVKRLATDGGALPRVQEAWLRLGAKLTRRGDAVRIDALTVASASGAIALDGQGTVPPRTGDEFHLRGRAPAAVALMMAPRRPLGGHIRFDVQGVPVEGGVSGKALVVFEGLRLGAPRLRDLAPLDVEVRVEGRTANESAQGSLAIVGDKIRIGLEGAGGWSGKTTFDVKGSCACDLARLHQLLAPFADLPDAMGIRGGLESSEMRASRAANGDVTVRVRAEVRDCVVTGVLDEPIVRDRTEVDIDATLRDGGNRLELKRGRLDQLDANGHVVGLQGDRIESIDLAVKGRIIFVPLFARLAGVDELEGLVDLDLRASMTPQGARTDGEAVFKNLLVAGGFGRIRRSTLTLRGHVRETDGVIAADVTALADGVTARITGTRPRGGNTADARVELNLRDLAELERIAPGFAWPSGVAAAGPARVVTHVRVDGRTLEAQTTVDAAPLTATVDGRTYKERLTAAATMRYAGDVWSGALTSLALAEHGVTASCPRVRLDAGRWTFGGAEVAFPLTSVAKFAPDLAKLRLAGRGTARADVTLDDHWAVAGSVRLAGLALDLNGARLKGRDLDVTVAAGDAGGPIAFERLQLRGGGTTITGRGTLDKLTVHMEGAPAHLGDIVPAIENIAGFVLDATLTRNPVPRAVGSFKFARARIDGSVFEDVNATLDIKKPRDLDARVRLTVGRAVVDDVTVLGATVDARGIGAAIPATVRTARVIVDGQAFEQVSFDGGFNLDKPLTFTGDVAFRQSILADQRLADGSVRIRYHPDRTELTDIRTRINDGLLTGSLFINTSRPGAPAWTGNAKIDNVALTARLGRALSFVLPILRLSNDPKEARLEGTVHGEATLSAVGFATSDLVRTLGGSGAIELKKMSVKGSVLLPLLSLRLSKLITGRPYKFSDVNIRFRIVDRVVKPEPIRLIGEPFGISIRGEARLDGNIDFLVTPDQLPIPLRVSGPIDAPRVRPAPLAGLPNPFRKDR